MQTDWYPLRQFALALVVLVGGVLEGEIAFARSAILSSVSSDSIPDWVPFQGEQDEALAVALSYFRAVDQGSYAEAYAMLSGSMKASMSEPAFEVTEKAFNMKAGPVVERRPTAITWTKHPENGSNPGTFAAIDFVDLFKNIDRACSYLVLIRTDDGSGMRVLRTQMASLDNATASAIATKNSPGEVDQVWRTLARQYPHCPK